MESTNSSTEASSNTNNNNTPRTEDDQSKKKRHYRRRNNKNENANSSSSSSSKKPTNKPRDKRPNNNEGTSSAAEETSATEKKTTTSNSKRSARKVRKPKEKGQQQEKQTKDQQQEQRRELLKRLKKSLRTETEDSSSANNEDAEKEEGRGKQAQNDTEDEDEDEEVCFICTRPVDYYALAPCDHRTCHMCTLRLRVLYGTKNCAYCKVEATKVVFTNDEERPYENYKREDTPFYDKKYGIRFETEEMYNETMVLLQHNCPDIDCEAEAFDSWNTLKRHVKQAHNGKLLCDLCLRNKKIFSHEHTLYTNAQLQKHYREGDASFNKDDETGFTGHPECVFCRTRFYGGDELFEHCRSKHEQCHLCVKHGIQHQYYANYDSLEKHFNKEHYLCQFKECLDNKFVVFDTDIDLKAHELKEHSGALSRQQRAKQSRVDVNLSYSGEQSRGNNRNRQGDSSGSSGNANSNAPALSAADFPSINGRPTPISVLASQRAQSRLTEREQWPMLGEEPNASSSGRSSPAVSNESATSIGSRHAAALDRVANLIKNVEKVIKFRQLTTAFTSLSLDTATFVNEVYELCGKDAKLTAKALEAAKDLVDNKALRSDMIQIWNRKDDPNDTQQTTAPRVLVVSPGRSTSNRSQTSARKPAGVWDKVASAAMDAGARRANFPPIGVSQTPWSGSSTPQSSSTADLQELFPALPSSTRSSRRADINALLRKPNTTQWSGATSPSSAATPATDLEYSDSNDTNNNRKKKGKKGKQVLFRVGL